MDRDHVADIELSLHFVPQQETLATGILGPPGLSEYFLLIHGFLHFEEQLKGMRATF